MKIYEGFNFAPYFKKYLDSKGIKYVFVSEVLNVPYRTLLSKLRNDGFSYSEITYLDFYFDDLIYLDNFKAFLKLRKEYSSEE